MSGKRGHIPIRRCVACGDRKPQAELIRLMLDEQGNLVVTEGSRRLGRGAYSCPTESCRRKTLAKGAYARSLKRRALIGDQEALGQHMARRARMLLAETE